MDECSFNNLCPESSQCINTVGSYTCACDVGYFHDEHQNMCIGKGISQYVIGLYRINFSL